MRSLKTSHHYHAVSDRECEGCGQRPRNNHAKFIRKMNKIKVLFYSAIGTIFL
jgi:hypothetical protein